ncbi:hypothetical protein GUJ93_ZPchr0001g31732 [Zizania palustris]|uniref:Uncharacterized protein n=1 Tax=Zizania palustris TaxID=103762 RepID=A0A8J5VDI4_ZIZPA|nr:hypothetical protein GUJ93_ZPchr0001g31732 [Zizania palustris]
MPPTNQQDHTTAPIMTDFEDPQPTLAKMMAQIKDLITAVTVLSTTTASYSLAIQRLDHGRQPLSYLRDFTSGTRLDKGINHTPTYPTITISTIKGPTLGTDALDIQQGSSQ